MIKPAGTINGYVRSTLFIGKKSYTFDGTTLDMVKVAVAHGAKAGTIVYANFGGMLRSNATKMRITSAPHDTRAGGFWADRIWV